LKGKLLGFGIFAIVAVMGVAIHLFSDQDPVSAVKGYAGGEKMDFLADPEVAARSANDTASPSTRRKPVRSK
jgi:hypothetical protein